MIINVLECSFQFSLFISDTYWDHDEPFQKKPKFNLSLCGLVTAGKNNRRTLSGTAKVVATAYYK